ncbi:MAG TPA: thioredoxin domain-containing protein [Chthoniobacterales bacterium]|nr:thioredoxin domain-containing protein [Chthoniobacterales bacterium]
MKRYLPFIIVALVAIVTLASGTILYRAKRPPELTISKELALKKEAESGLHIRGPANAPITLEEFGDFQCPPCGLLAGPVKQIEHDFEPKVRVIFHHFPLPNHQHARTAACAAEAAGLQGKFWEMHDLIYREQKNWSKATDAAAMFASYAGMLGLDLERFKKDITSEQVNERVSADQKRGAALGVQNTPTIFLNNKAIPPTDLAPDRLRLVIEEAVKQPAPAP